VIRLSWIQHGTPEYLSMISLRRAILRRPLGLDFTPEQLESEDRDLHLAAWEEDQLVGCLLLTNRGEAVVQMRQVAVLESRQGQGIGRALVLECEEEARRRGFTRMMLHARDTAVPFYERLGYRSVGEPFVEVTIPHQEMEKML
jgi:predicted N-acetyltransferase YhbS